MDTISPELKKAIPFDSGKLDRLLEEADIDVLVVTSKHNIHYLLGGYRFFFFDYMDAIGTSRYLPVLVYPRGKPENAAYIGARLEVYEKQLDRFWTPTVETRSSGSTDAIAAAMTHIQRLGGPFRTVGIETAFLPVDAADILRDGLGHSQFADAHFPLERLRASKTAHELTLLREASNRVVESMQAVFAKAAPGVTKRELVGMLRREEVARDLVFEYCLITAGDSTNRAPSDQRLEAGDIMSLDTGGNYQGYIGDLCRMGILGEPDAELVELLGVIDEVQQAARKPVRMGAQGQEVFAAAEQVLRASPHRGYVDFVAHGMGLVSHEAPRLTSRGPVPYAGYDEERGLESGMVLSVETTMHHPRRGFIKLEDTLAVTYAGWEAFGDAARGWNKAA